MGARSMELKDVAPVVVPLRYEDETTPVPDDFIRQVEQALYNLRDKQHLTVRFIGYSDDAPLTDRNERIYGDHLALSKASIMRPETNRAWTASGGSARFHSSSTADVSLDKAFRGPLTSPALRVASACRY